MIYTIEKRSAFGGGTMDSWWEVRSYDCRTAIGVLVGGKCLKGAKKISEARDYCAKRKLSYEER